MSETMAMNEANLDILERMLAAGIPPKVSDGKALVNEVRRLKRELEAERADHEQTYLRLADLDASLGGAMCG